MGYFRTLTAQCAQLEKLFQREDRWLILINADPDALASALALQRIMQRKVKAVGIMHVNEVRRPDNLSMIRYLRIPTEFYDPEKAREYNKFALVDSQPHHHPLFEGVRFSIVIDHHPLVPEKPVRADFVEIKTEYGANATILVEYLHALRIKPGKRLATALQYAIKADTNSFGRAFADVDVRAFRMLTPLADQGLLRKVARSEFRLDWLHYFSRAIEQIRFDKNGLHVFMGPVENPDVLVILADFFMGVQEISWTTVAGLFDQRIVCIFRGDGQSRGVRNLGQLAADTFGDVGSAGGHATMARAEIPLAAIGDEDPEHFVWSRLCRKRSHGQRTTAPAVTG
ncbi:DHH family phosphoesterase [Megalodesulfovibrio gigas]|uniref:Putative phosphoesterase RecJ domain-containing protein n=1 Tax=Megalodesulfovibrio gigas (strain ATCC 19364 / DSM 1382 / NCIMB 9332 / VKM B-1759) TaxID=1121448 RepID=T2G8N3_MEGG1|nr:DHH family phosphoesterase [Megalodesulfovibrio gigas]AGW12496.1 putative phosphoesterase RecJ domain-containing protein [Megalodesulfovibrio gigas DSM 1382 = ATCC 19364]